MPVNVAFGPSAGVIGQMGFGAGKRQYTDRRDQVERESKRQMLSDAMNFTRFLREGRKPEEDHQRAMARMDKQQRLQVKTMDHQAAIQKTTETWRQDVADDRRAAQAKQLDQLEYDLDQEMLGLPPDMSEMEKQTWRTRAYQKGAHKIGTMQAAGPDIQPFKHFDHDGTMYRQNMDGSVTNVSAEQAETKAKRQAAATKSAVETNKVVLDAQKQAAEPYNLDIQADREELKEVTSGYTGNKTETPTPPRPKDPAAVEAYEKKVAQINLDNQELKEWKAEKKALRDGIRLKIQQRDEAVGDAAIAMYQSLGGVEGVGGSMTSSLYKEALKKKAARVEAAAEENQRARVREDLKAATQGDLAAAQRITQSTTSDPGLVPPRSSEAAALADLTAPGAQGPDFTTVAGDKISAPQAAALFSGEAGINPEAQKALQIAFGVGQKDVQKWNAENKEKNPTVKTSVVSVDGTMKTVQIKQRDADLINNEVFPVRDQLERRRTEAQKAIDRIDSGEDTVKNQNVIADLKEQKDVMDKMLAILETRHTLLESGGGDTFGYGTAMSKKTPVLIEFEELKARRKKLVEDIAAGGKTVTDMQLRGVRKLAGENPLGKNAARFLRGTGVPSIAEHLSKSEAELADPEKTPWYLQSAGALWKNYLEPEEKTPEEERESYRETLDTLGQMGT